MDIDWENSRKQWAGNLSRAPGPAKATCFANMVTQVERLKAARPEVKGWVYRNIVKADNWFEPVQKIIDDERYEGWFVKFDRAKLASNITTSPPCDNNYDPPKCSTLYHDQTLVPNIGRKAAGICVGACDCGKHPCGEYLFDLRNASLHKWLLEEYIGGPTGMGHKDVSGMFLDDQWDLIKGPSEYVCGGKLPCEPLHDMGLSPTDVKELTVAWSTAQAAVHHKIVESGGFDWALFNCRFAPTATQPCTMSAVSPWAAAAGYPGTPCPGCVANVSQQCSAFFRSACTPEAPLGELALFLGLTRQKHRTLVNATGQLPALIQDLSTFLLVRGKYAWLGHGWTGNVSADAALPSAARTLNIWRLVNRAITIREIGRRSSRSTTARR